MTCFDSIAEWLFPTRCFLCGELTGGDALCVACAQKWKQSVTQGSSWERYSLRGVDLLCTLSPYSVRDDDPVSSFLRRAKRVRRQKAIVFAATEATQQLLQNTERVWCSVTVVPVPRSPAAVRKFGFDQAQLLARQIAEQLHCPYCQALEHTGSTKQKSLNRAQRMENAVSSYSVADACVSAVYGRHILLVDDVVTTGATMSVCAELLRKCGAVSVDAFAMARTAK